MKSGRRSSVEQRFVGSRSGDVGTAVRSILVATLMGIAVAATAIESVETRSLDGSRNRWLVSREDGQAVSKVLVVFPGGDGNLGLTDATPAPAPATGGGFQAAMRARLPGKGIAVVFVDSPARQPSMSPEYRESDDYRRIVAALFAELGAAFPDAKLYALGYSNGAAAAVAAGKQPRVAGVILLSGIYRRYSEISWAGDVAVPILVIHHEADRCIPPEFDDSFRLTLRPTMVRAVPQVYAASPCGPLSAHQFLGQEDVVLDAMRNWLETGRAPSRIR